MSYALVSGEYVLQIEEAEFPVNPAFVWIDVTTVSPPPQPGWTYADGAFTAPPEPPALTLAQQAQALLGGGLAVTSTATPALNGTYAADPASLSYINSEVGSIALNATFADGTATVDWPDMSGALHAFTVAQFRTFAGAMGIFVSGVRKCVIGAPAAALPAAAATIP